MLEYNEVPPEELYESLQEFMKENQEELRLQSDAFETNEFRITVNQLLKNSNETVVMQILFFF